MEKVRYHAGDQVGEKEHYKEFWIWENKLLTSIKRETSIGIETMKMTYNGKKIQTIDIEKKKIIFSYKNGKIDKIESTGDDGYMKITVKVRDKGDIVQLRYEMSGNSLVSKNGFEQAASDLLVINRMIMPGYPSEIMQKDFMEQKSTIENSKIDIVTILVTLQYNDKNIGKQTIENESSNIINVYSYTYDSKKNPFFYSFVELLEATVTGAPLFCSQNNIVSFTEESNTSIRTNCTYKYDSKNWPVSCEKKTVYDPNFLSSYSLETWTYTY